MVYKDYYPRPALAADSVKKMSAYSFYNYLAGLLNSGPGLIYPFLVLNCYGPEQSAYKRIYLIVAQAGVLATIALGLGYWMLISAVPKGLAKAYFLAHLVVALLVSGPLWVAIKQ